jgi:hypothetical protein
VTLKVRCPGPKCWKKVDIEITELPIRCNCPECGVELKLEVLYIPPRTTPAVSSLATAA